MTILIAGGGVAGLTLGLTLHQIGAPFRIYESAETVRPLGVGINLQPHAVRELFDLGLAPLLDRVGLRTQGYGFYSKAGLEIWREKRGLAAGYRWPQFSVHRGRLQIGLYNELIARAGADAVVTGQRAIGYENRPHGAALRLVDAKTRAQTVVEGDAVIGADGVHSAIRAQMVPGEGPPVWGGAVLWRATSEAKPFLDGASMALIGHDWKRVVAYPISRPDPDTGLATINWIAELRFDASAGWNREDWNRRADIADFLPEFEDWRFDWIDPVALMRSAGAIYEYPMVDRDPLDSWTEGRVTLIGDAAHATYPVGSSGASQAIVDARTLAAKLLATGVGPKALAAYDAEIRPGANRVVATNRAGGGPDAILQLVEDRCGGMFNDISDVIPRDELAAHAAKYKEIAGFAIDALNAAPPTIPQGARLGG